MIDIDKLDEQLELALTGDVRVHRLPRPVEPAPPSKAAAPRQSTSAGRTRAVARPLVRAAKVPASRSAPSRPRPPVPTSPPVVSSPAAPNHCDPDPQLEGHARRLSELLGFGLLDECDAEISAHRSLTMAKGTPQALRDAAAWSAMRATLGGRKEEARSAVAAVLSHGREAGDPGAAERHLAVLYGVVSEWGDDGERYKLLDRCRERAYCHDELPWRAALTLVLARMGRFDEACREFDATSSRYLDGGGGLPPLDAGTHLAEAAWLLGDPTRSAVLVPVAATWTMPVVSIARGWICKGASARFRALVAAATGSWAQADTDFAEAVELHRALGAQPLLARTLYEWACTLSGRNEAGAALHYDESARIARRLGLTGLPAGVAAASPLAI